MLFPIIMFGNNTYSTDPNSYKTSKNYILKSKFFSNYIDNYYVPNNNNQNIINFYDRNQVYEKEIKLLRKENNDLNEQLFSVRNKLLSQERTYKLMQNYIKTLKENISKSNNENNNLNNKLSNISIQLNTKIKENNKLLNTIGNLKIEEEKLKSKIKEIQQELLKVEEYKKQINDLLKKNKQLNDKLSQVQKDNSDLQQKLSNYTQLKQELLELQSKKEKLNNILSNNKHYIFSIENQIQEKNQQVSDLKQQIKIGNQEISKFKLHEKENNKKIYDLEKQIEMLINKNKKFNNLQITSQSININDINELKQNNKSEYNNSNAEDINNNNSCVKNINNGEQKDNNNSVQNINSIANENNNIVNNTNNIIPNDSIINHDLNVPSINNKSLSNNKITDEINNNEDIKDNQIEKTQNEIVQGDKSEISLKETQEENINKLESSNKVKKKKKHRKKNKKVQDNNINSNQDTKQEDEKVKNDNNIENKYNNNETIIDNNVNYNRDNTKIIYSNSNDIENKNNNKSNEESVNTYVDEHNNHEGCMERNIRNLQKKIRGLLSEHYVNTSYQDKKSELFSKIIKKYGEQRYNIKYLKDTTHDILYTLLIDDNIKYTKDDYNMIQEQHQNMIDHLYNQLTIEENAIKVSSNSIKLYISNDDNSLLTKGQITYRNLIFFMIGKILEIQKHNYDAKNVNEKMKLPIPLVKMNNTNILSFFPKNNVQNCVDLINDNIYYNIGYYYKCKNPILQKDILQHYDGNKNEIVQYLKDELEKDIKVLKKYLETTKQNILYILHKLNGVNNNKELKNEVSNIIYKQYYKYYLVDILSYAHFLSISDINGNAIDCEYKKVIEILCNQLLCITNIAKTSTNVQQLIKRIDEMLKNSIEQFIPYIKYWYEMDQRLLMYETSEGNYCKTSEGNCCETSEGTKTSEEDYLEISLRIEGYADNISQELSFDKDLTLKDLTNTINNFLQNNLRLNYTFKF